MKPRSNLLTVVTATTDPLRPVDGDRRVIDLITGWADRATLLPRIIVLVNGPASEESPVVEAAHLAWAGTAEYLGVVPAFALGVELALQLTPPAEVIACLHDDVRIDEDGWDDQIYQAFRDARVGLVGFGGGRGLGADDIYRTDYSPMQLARQDFVSNMQDAKAHGRRVTKPMRVSCLDGLSQIGRRQYWEHEGTNHFQRLADMGIVHHAYDAALGCEAARQGWQTWMIPVRCHHYGGMTAVADQGYHRWATSQHPDGDQGFWQHAHRQVYDAYRDVLPLRLER